jgi:hypothetical protein
LSRTETPRYPHTYSVETVIGAMLLALGKRASDSEEVADMLVTATKQSATSFEDMLVAMIIAGGGSDGGGDLSGESQFAEAA